MVRLTPVQTIPILVFVDRVRFRSEHDSKINKPNPRIELRRHVQPLRLPTVRSVIARLKHRAVLIAWHTIPEHNVAIVITCSRVITHKASRHHNVSFSHSHSPLVSDEPARNHGSEAVKDL